MRLVVDTNVFVSAALSDLSWPANVLRWIAKYEGLLKTGATEQEVMQVLNRPRLAPKISPVFLDGLKQIFTKAELVTITEHVTACRDPKDNKFLELALNGQADVIISGDADLLVLDTFRGIPIIAPAAFAQARNVRKRT